MTYFIRTHILSDEAEHFGLFIYLNKLPYLDIKQIKKFTNNANKIIIYIERRKKIEFILVYQTR